MLLYNVISNLISLFPKNYFYRETFYIPHIGFLREILAYFFPKVLGKQVGSYMG